MSDNLFGARWWRFDFHTHTPASMDYGKGRNQRELEKRSPREWLLDFMRAEVHCVAITDHNTGDWINPLQEEYRRMKSNPPDDFRKLTLFPGVEITVDGGTHMLAIFDPSCSASEVVSLLGAVGFPSDKHGTSDACTKKSVIEVAQAIRSSGGLAIPAHTDREKGLFQVEEGLSKVDRLTLRTLLEADVLDAIEVVNAQFEPPSIYRTVDPALPRILGTDSHHPPGTPAKNYPGSRFTWVKMGEPSLEGLRLALLDGSPLSVLRSDDEISNPNEQPRLTIDSIEIQDTRYMGKSEFATAHFSPWLSAIIGGRGSGKSTLVEMTRLGMQREADLPRRLQQDFREFVRTSSSSRESGVILDSTEVRINLRKDGLCYRLRWRPGGSGPVIEQKMSNQSWKEVPGEVTSRFPVRILSQKQVFEIANDPNALLRLVDEAQSVNPTERQSKREQAESDFMSLKNHARSLESRLSNRERLEGELADVERQISLFEKGENQDLHRRFRSVRRQRQVFDERADEMKANVSALRQVVETVEPSSFPSDLFEAVPDAMAMMTDAVKRQANIATRLRRKADELDDFQEEWSARVAESQWSKEAQLSAEQYSVFVTQLTEQGGGDPEAYETLTQRQHEIRKEIDALESVRREKDDVERQASRLLQQLEKDRRDLTADRVAFLNSVLDNNPYVQIEVVPFGLDPREAEDGFLRALGREDRGLESILNDAGNRGILAELFRNAPDDSAGRGDSLAMSIRDLKNRFARIHAGEVGELGKYLSNHLRRMTPEQMDRFHLWWPEDALQVRYRRATTDKFVSLKRGSPGQKSAAILAFLLSYGDDPIILDQPEDDLDNYLIYDLIVRQMRENKRRRQVIVATHNPNIVVNGDAEKVISMDHKNGQCVVTPTGTGCLQDGGVRARICEVMEGGRRAFESRYRRLSGDFGHT